MEAYAGAPVVGIDLHRRGSVIVRTTGAGEPLERVRIVRDGDSLATVMARDGESPDVGSSGARPTPACRAGRAHCFECDRPFLSLSWP